MGSADGHEDAGGGEVSDVFRQLEMLREQLKGAKNTT